MQVKRFAAMIQESSDSELSDIPSDNIPVQPPAKRAKVIAKKGKKVVEKTKDVKGKPTKKVSKVDVNPSIRIRTTPYTLYELIGRLNEAQKTVIRNMGFGSILDIKIDSVPGSLAHFVVDKLDITEKVLKIETGTINVSRQAVHDILGLPMGEVNISTMPSKLIGEGASPYSGKWKDNFGGKKGRPNNVLHLLQHTELADFEFKMNFLLLVVGTMFGLDKNGGFTVGSIKSILDSIGENTDIQSLDWCGFLIEQMKGCKDDWPPSKKGYYFCGPTTFLVLLYLDATFCEQLPVKRSRPAINYWNRVYMAERVEAELAANKVFGKLPLQPPFECIDKVLAVQASEPTQKEAFLAKLNQQIMMLDSSFDDGVALFPEDLKLSQFRSKFKDSVTEYFNEDERDEAVQTPTRHDAEEIIDPLSAIVPFGERVGGMVGERR